MRVSIRHAAVLTALALAGTGAAHAQITTAGSGGGGGKCCAPPPPPPPSQCCNGGPIITPPSINIGGPQVNVGVNVNTSVNVNVNANANARASASASANNSNVIYAGGGGYVQQSYAPASSALTGLSLASSALEVIEEERTRTVQGWRYVRAVCLDDSGTPHPASRIDEDPTVPQEYSGEIYRCMAGTAMEVTLSETENFEHGETLSCVKGEALRYEDGEIFCAPQTDQRNCYERSLLRLHGPGIKRIYEYYEETYTERVEQEVSRTTVSEATLMLDGGVGGHR